MTLPARSLGRRIGDSFSTETAVLGTIAVDETRFQFRDNHNNQGAIGNFAIPGIDVSGSFKDGVRIGDQEKLAEFYPPLGDALKQNFHGWDCFILSADPRLAKLIGLKPTRRMPLYNGALECRLLEYRIVAGGMRKRATGEQSLP